VIHIDIGITERKIMSISGIENYGCTNEYSNVDELDIENESEEI
jgi:hypothetical protein